MKLILLLFVAPLLSLHAQNGTVRFEPAPLAGGAQLVPQWSEAGLHFETPSGLVINGSANSDYPFNGTSYLQTLFGQGPLTISSGAGQPFSLFSVDLAEYSTLFAAPRMISFTGIQVGGGTVSTAFLLDGIIDGPGGSADFQTFFFPATFTNLTQVTVATDVYSMDNVVIGIVPEPSTVVLICAGFCSAAVWRCFRRKGARTLPRNDSSTC